MEIERDRWEKVPARDVLPVIAPVMTGPDTTNGVPDADGAEVVVDVTEKTPSQGLTGAVDGVDGAGADSPSM